MSTASLYGRRVVEQARRVNLHPNTIHRLIHKHGLPATLVGGQWRIKDSDLDRFFAERTAARLGKPAPADSKAHDDADAALAAAGW